MSACERPVTSETSDANRRWEWPTPTTTPWTGATSSRSGAALVDRHSRSVVSHSSILPDSDIDRKHPTEASESTVTGDALSAGPRTPQVMGKRLQKEPQRPPVHQRLSRVANLMDNSSDLSQAPESDDPMVAAASAQKPRLRFTFPSGSTPLKGYTIKRGLGIGGFGEVYFAVSASGKEVALKRIARNLDVELRGVKQCLNLKHANLIGLWDIQVDDHHENWVVMEYVSGPSLRDVLQANPNGLPMDDVIWWFQGISAGTHYLHQNGIVHRDLKPGNVFHDNEAQLVKIGDYGLSKFISCSQRSGHTESVGTVHYMAPEIGRGIYGREIDVYSLGIVLFELLTGRVPFEGECTQEIIMKHLTAEPNVSSLAAPFDHVVQRALVKDPEQRYPTVLSMLSDLPKEFWPPALRRSVLQLQDTGKHVFPALPESESETGSPSPAAKPAEVETTPASQDTANAAEASSRAETSSRGRLPQPLVSSPRLANRKSAAGREFNQPPRPAGSSRHSIRDEARIYYKESTPSETPDASSSLGQHFSQVESAMVFGDVQYHDVVDAEVVAEESKLSAAPIVKPGAIPPLPEAESNQETLSRRTRKSWLQDSRYLTATETYRQQLSGTERLTQLLHGCLISSAIMVLVAILASLVARADGWTATETDDLFAYGAWVFATGTGVSWMLLTLAFLWAPHTRLTSGRVAALIPISLISAALASWIGSLIDVPFAQFAGSNEMLQRGYLGSLLNFHGVPQFLGYALFFFSAFVVCLWWRQASPIRVYRVSIFPVLRSFIAGALFSFLLGTDPLLPAIFCAGLSLAVQWSASYYDDAQRQQIRSASIQA